MAILDDKLVLSDKQRICFTAATTRTLSTNLIDLGAEDLGIGAGTPLYLSIRTCATFTHGSPLTGGISFKLKSATGTAFNDTASIIEKTMLASTLKANQTILSVSLPTTGVKRYLRLLYAKSTQANTGYTNSFVDAWIGPTQLETDVGT
jgi:hypothetical protein